MSYESQQGFFFDKMMNYVKDSKNYPDGVVKYTNFSQGSLLYTLFSAFSVALDESNYKYYLAKEESSVLRATGEALVGLGHNWGVTKNGATAGLGSFLLSKNIPSSTDTFIPKGVLITTLPDSKGFTVQYITTDNCTIAAGSTSVKVTAVCSVPGNGKAGNLSAGTKLLIGSAVPGIDSVSLLENISNGFDEEDDESFRKRILSVIKNAQSKGTGTEKDFINWAMSVPGVQTVSILPLNRGPLTVDILIRSKNGMPDTALLNQVQNTVNERKPMLADVKVIAPTPILIDITVKVVLDSNYTISSLTTAITTVINDYINSIQCGGVVYNNKLLAAVLTVKGVLDCQVILSIGTSVKTNIQLGKQEMAIVNNINIS